MVVEVYGAKTGLYPLGYDSCQGNKSRHKDGERS